MELAGTYGTPLYVYDEATLRGEAQRTLLAFRLSGARVSYASKACSTLGVLRILREEGLCLDVVSGGELEAGVRAGFHPSQIHLHGNYKSDAELERAVRLGLHAVVVDSVHELHALLETADRLDTKVPIMLRLTLPIEAETHPHLQTSGYRSKFGIFIDSDEERAALGMLKMHPEVLRLIGLHVHLGSQIGDAGIYRRAAEELLVHANALRTRGYSLEEISMGGGWAVPYTPDAPRLCPEDVRDALAPAFERFPQYRLAVEPGRSTVARSAVALYRAGSVKVQGELRTVAVDGGMGDNPRHALYGARYTAFLPGKPTAPPLGKAVIAGRYCESGDMLVRDVELPHVEPGDVVCVPVAGAYQLSMASAYNLVPPPAAVLVRDGQARLLTRRATVQDLLAREVDFL